MANKNRYHSTGQQMLNILPIFSSKVKNLLILCSCLLLVRFIVYLTTPIYHILVNEELISIRSDKLLRMRDRTNITIMGIGRDIADSASEILRQIKELGELFQYFQVILIEGNSSDSTLRTFKTWKKANPTVNINIITPILKSQYEIDGHFAGKLLPREGRLSYARNIGLIELERLPRTEYIVMVDMDIVGWEVSGIMDSFEKRDKWDVVCANGVILHGLFRDTYAFRAPGITPNHHWAGTDFLDYNLSKAELPKRRQNYKTMKARAQAMMAGEDTSGSSSGPLVEVDSCFGGLAIYRYDAINGCTYTYRHQEPPYMLECEHVLFHKCLKHRHHARIFANRDMKLWYGHGILQLPYSKLAKATYDALFK